MDVQQLLLLLIVVVVVFGLGVVIANRRRAGTTTHDDGAATRTATPTGQSEGSGVATAVLEPDLDDGTVPDGTVSDGTVLDTHVVEPVTLRSRLGRARAAFAGAMAGVLGRSGIDDGTWEELEEALLRADVGVRVVDALLDDLRAEVEAEGITDPDALLVSLRALMVGRLAGTDRSLDLDEASEGPTIWLFVGVNGVGKTTTIGKVGAQQVAAGRTVLMAAGDTFRAAAAEQLGTWADRAGAELVRGAEGGDPSSVVFDGVERATARSIDLVLADTAGRLHTKTNLMDELRKVRRVAEKGAGRVTETLLVIDATTGQNGLTQAREFGEATQVTGVVLTKLDGSAKGGIVFAVETELGIPVKLVGVGETIDDLVPFDPTEFVDALFEG